MADRIVIDNLLRAERLGLSTNGNPRFRLVCQRASYTTMSDAACSYDVENIARRVPYGGSLPVELRLTKAGRVWMIEQAT